MTSLSARKDAWRSDAGTLPVTVLIAARNEEVNLPKCLRSLGRAQRVILLDSRSADRSAIIAQEFGAEVIQFDYQGGYPKKRQWALEHVAIKTPWTLLLDADEEMTAQLWDEIAAVASATKSHDAYLIVKGFHFLGRRFGYGGFSHAAVLLFKTGRARFEKSPAASSKYDMEIHERVLVDGSIGKLKGHLVHQDFKGLAAYIERHNAYSTWEAQVRAAYFDAGAFGPDTVRPRLTGDAQERRRFLKGIAIRTPGEPLWWFCYHYFIRLGFLEGRPGLIASLLRSFYIAEARAKLYELRRGQEAKRE